MLCYSSVHQAPGWNQNSRLDLLHAIFVHKTLTIDAYHENTGDKSIHDGHYYSDKGPGTVVLALPAFALSAGILGVFDIEIDSRKGWLISDWITTALSLGLVTALGGACMFIFLCKLLAARFNSQLSAHASKGQDDSNDRAHPYAFLSTLAVFVGSLPFPYATMLFSHAAVIGLLCIALWAIADDECLVRHLSVHTKIREPKSETKAALDRQPSAANWARRHLFAGLLCGLAIASEFPAAMAAGGVLALALLTGWKRGLVVTLGAMPPLLLLLAHNWACFGGPFSFGYHHLALEEFQEMNKGLFGITFPPKAGNAYLLLLSPARGLFFWTPFFLMAFLGFKQLWGASRNIFWIALIIVVMQVIAISGYYMPDGGSAIGARHLAPLIPFLTIAAAFGLERIPYSGSLLVIYSVLLTGIGTWITAMPYSSMSNPLLELYLPRLIQDVFTYNLGTLLGLPNYASLALLGGFVVLAFIMGGAIPLHRAK